jgi:hypothetical protein
VRKEVKNLKSSWPELWGLSLQDNLLVQRRLCAFASLIVHPKTPWVEEGVSGGAKAEENRRFEIPVTAA